MSKVWCHPYTKHMHQFMQENIGTVMDLSASQEIGTLGKMSAGDGGYADFAQLSREKPHVYSFINKRAELDDDEITAYEQYLSKFIATTKTFSDQTIYICTLTTW